MTQIMKIEITSIRNAISLDNNSNEYIILLTTLILDRKNISIYLYISSMLDQCHHPFLNIILERSHINIQKNNYYSTN